MTRRKVLAINSLPAFGNAGLKCVLSVLQKEVIPVPSLILSGTGNIKGFKKYDYDFPNNLETTLKHLSDHEIRVVLYVGYLGNASQVAIIASAIEQFQSIIEFIVIDPVMGDNGKAYVPQAIMESWSTLLKFADWATPNVTEVKLLTNCEDTETGIQQLRTTFPDTKWIITSYSSNELSISNYLITNEYSFKLDHPLRGAYVTGTGDTFTSSFVNFHYLRGMAPKEALEKASQLTLQYIDDTLRS